MLEVAQTQARFRQHAAKRIQKLPQSQTQFADPRELELAMQVQVTWEDLTTGEVISEYSIPLDSDTAMLFTSSNFAPEIGQSLATAIHENVQQTAQQIVNMMDFPW